MIINQVIHSKVFLGVCILKCLGVKCCDIWNLFSNGLANMYVQPHIDKANTAIFYQLLNLSVVDMNDHCPILSTNLYVWNFYSK